MYGLCLMEDTECSYEDHLQENKIVAIALFCLGVISFATATIGVALIRSFGLAFGLVALDGRYGVLRYTGHQREIMDEIRRQNDIVRQQRLDQGQGQALPPGLQGFTNFGFEAPLPPPYSENAMQVSAITNGHITVVQTQSDSAIISTDPPKYSDIEPSVVLADLPPPYSEIPGNSTNTTREDNTKL